MYCPQCGSKNRDDLKFCTHCGTNLGLVSSALSSKGAEPAAAGPMVDLLKKYYDGRQSTAVGAGSILIGLVLMAIILRLRVPENLAGVLVTALAGCALVYGAIAVIAGIARWIEANSEMKAMNHPALRPHLSTPPAKEFITAPTDKSFPDHVAVSVTEHTTQQLEERLREKQAERS